MAPTYQHGDRVLVRHRPGHRMRTGEVALVDLPESIRPIPDGVSPADSLRSTSPSVVLPSRIGTCARSKPVS